MKTGCIAVMILLLVQATARSCEYCFISEHGYVFDMNRTLIRLDTRYQSFSGLTNSSSTTDNVSTQYVTSFLTLNYATGRWGYTLAVPFVYRHQENTFTGTNSLHYEHVGRVVSTIDSSSLESHSVRGVGDISALGRFAVFSLSGDKFASIFLQGGAKLATGSINARDAYGYLLHPHLQLGTGTTVALVGASGSYGGPKQSFDMSLLAGLPVHYFGPFREAASLNYDATFRFRWLPDDAEDGPMLIQHLGVIGQLSSRELYRGAPVLDSGGHYMFLNFGLTFIPIPGFNIDLFAQIPMIKNLNGNQIDEQFRVASGVQVSL
ncbi:MAG TPA: hypothetical protein VK569_06445 [Bacteroidota bacterium]|nr:hypothetical protein [Bacteroidota bacterium]